MHVDSFLFNSKRPLSQPQVQVVPVGTQFNDYALWVPMPRAPKTGSLDRRSERPSADGSSRDARSPVRSFFLAMPLLLVQKTGVLRLGRFPTTSPGGAAAADPWLPRGGQRRETDVTSVVSLFKLGRQRGPLV